MSQVAVVSALLCAPSRSTCGILQGRKSHCLLGKQWKLRGMVLENGRWRQQDGKGKQAWRAESRNKSGVRKNQSGSGESQLAVLATAGRACNPGAGLGGGDE